MKRALVTGANRGLGFATARKLAERGYSVTITSRHLAAGERALFELHRDLPGAEIECLPLDLTDRSSARTLAASLIDREAPLDVLVNNAGILVTPETPTFTADGIETTFATNVLGPYYLTYLLMPVLERSSSARIVNVSSQTHMPGSRGPEVSFEFDDLKAQKHYEPTVAYKNSKLALLWFTYELARRLPPRHITCNAVCPGFVPTTIAHDVHGFMRLLMRTVMPLMPFAHTVDEATDTFVMAACDAELEGVTGKFFTEYDEIDSSPESYDEGKQKRLWETCRRMLDVPDWP